MSGACPNCSAPVDATFGLKNCSSCHVLLYVDFDGQVEMARQGSETPDVANSQTHTEWPAFTESLTPEASGETVPPPEEIATNDQLENSATIVIPALRDENPRAPHDMATTIESVQAFANSELSDGREGLYNFDILISGIDSVKVRADLKDALTDKRFVWEVETLLRSIRQGRLVIEGLSAVKTSVLIHRLKELPLELSWEPRTIKE